MTCELEPKETILPRRDFAIYSSVGNAFAMRGFVDYTPAPTLTQSFNGHSIPADSMPVVEKSGDNHAIYMETVTAIIAFRDKIQGEVDEKILSRIVSAAIDSAVRVLAFQIKKPS